MREQLTNEQLNDLCQVVHAHAVAVVKQAGGANHDLISVYCGTLAALAANTMLPETDKEEGINALCDEMKDIFWQIIRLKNLEKGLEETNEQS